MSDDRLLELLGHFEAEHPALYEQFDGVIVTPTLLDDMEAAHLGHHMSDTDGDDGVDGHEDLDDAFTAPEPDEPDDDEDDEPEVGDDGLTAEEREARYQRNRALMLANRGDRGPIAKYDWDHIRTQYVEGQGQLADGTTKWPTLMDLAAQFDVPYESIRKKSASQGWTGKRQEHRQRLDAERFRVRAEKITIETELLDDEALGVGKLGLALVRARLGDIATAYKDRPKDGITAGISTAELERLAKAGDLFHRIGLRSLGGDTDVQKFEVTGAAGGPIEIAGELGRDDPDRIAAVLGVLVQAGLGELFGAGEGGDRDARRASAIEARSRSHPEVPEG